MAKASRDLWGEKKSQGKVWEDVEKLLRGWQTQVGVGAVDLISACCAESEKQSLEANGKGGSRKENKTGEAGAAARPLILELQCFMASAGASLLGRQWSETEQKLQLRSEVEPQLFGELSSSLLRPLREIGKVHSHSILLAHGVSHQSHLHTFPTTPWQPARTSWAL